MEKKRNTKLTPLKLTLELKQVRQRDLAKTLGISPTELSFFCTGYTVPTVDMQEKIAGVLGVNRRELWE